MSDRWAQWLVEYPPKPFVLSRKAGWDAFVNSAPRPPLEVLSRSELSRLGPVEREDYDEARQVWHANLPTIRTQQLAHAYATIDQVMASGRRDGDRLRGSVVIDAAPNLGKTTIATRYARDFHRRVYRRSGPHTVDGHQRLPVVFVPLASASTLKGLNQQLLAFYGHPAADRVSASRLAALAVDCVISCETQLVIIDDVHFIDFRHKHGLEVSNHLKGLANEMPVTFIYVGVQLREKRFFDEGQLGEQAAYAQTSRRATRVEVVPFRIDTDAGIRGWVDLLRVIEPQLVLADARPGMLTDHAKELHRRTQGHIGSLMHLVERACLVAVASGVETISTQVLEHTTLDNAAESLSQAG